MFILKFLAIIIIIQVSKSSDNCNNFIGDKVKTFVDVGGSALKNITDPRTISLMEIDKDSRLDRLRRTISCHHHSPIQWISNSDLRPFTLKWVYNERQKVDELSNPNGWAWRFISEFVFEFKLGDVKSPILFSCQPIDPHKKCQQGYVEILHGKYMPSFKATTLPSSNTSIIGDGPKIGNLTREECELQLLVQEVKGHLLLYKWLHKAGRKMLIDKAIPTNSSIYFYNLFRNIQQERNCVKILSRNETCENCQEVSKDVLNSIIFHGKSENTEIVLKGLFTLPVNGNRKFYMQWEVPLLEMVHLQAIPQTIYVNRTYKVSCNVSSFYFSLGTILTTNKNILQNNSTETIERYKNYGNIEATRNFTFTKAGINQTIYCFAPQIKSTHWIVKSKTVFVDYPEAPKIINGSGNIKLWEESNGGVNKSIFCEAFGKPLPKLIWHFPLHALEKLVTIREQRLKNSRIRSIVKFPELRSEFKGIYKCVASNYINSVSHSFNLQLIRPTSNFFLSKKVKMWIGLTVIVLVIVFIGVILLLLREVRKQKVKYRTETEKVRKEFLNGTSKSDPMDQFGIFSRPYRSDYYEVPIEKWIIENENIGEGEFGIVRRGSVEINTEIHQVAVKMLKPCADLDDFKAFLLEIKVMEFVGYHPNVIQLLACSTHNFQNRDVYIGVEYCPNGCLQKYLVERKGIFQRREDPADRNSAFGSYANFTHSSLTELDLYIWAYQIAKGMEYLTSRNIIHMDLASRNVLLKADKVCKISDFGLSRFLNEEGDYVKKKMRIMPWKLLPPESLRHRRFSRASDVWAYGVLLFELFSLGEIPYANVTYSAQFVKNLENGMRLSKPSRATNNIYGLMLKCWDPDPILRPHFTQIKSAFSGILEKLNSPSKASQIFPEDELITQQDFIIEEYTAPTKKKSLSLISDPSSDNHYTNRVSGNLYLNC